MSRINMDLEPRPQAHWFICLDSVWASPGLMSTPTIAKQRHHRCLYYTTCLPVSQISRIHRVTYHQTAIIPGLPMIQITGRLLQPEVGNPHADHASRVFYVLQGSLRLLKGCQAARCKAAAFFGADNQRLQRGGLLAPEGGNVDMRLRYELPKSHSRRGPVWESGVCCKHEVHIESRVRVWAGVGHTVRPGEQLGLGGECLCAPKDASQQHALSQEGSNDHCADALSISVEHSSCNARRSVGLQSMESSSKKHVRVPG